MKPARPRGDVKIVTDNQQKAGTSIVPNTSTEELVAWLHAVHEEIDSQCKLRSSSSPWFRPDILKDQTDREAEINTELVKRGKLPQFTPFTDPAVDRSQDSVWQ